VIPNIDLDHVAVAAETQSDAWSCWVGDLGGTWVGGGATAGFASAQVAWRDGMRLEVLEPHLVEQNDFLRRFLDRSGPGPHHLTFKVADIRGALAVAEAAGFTPINVNLESPWWMEAFLHPKASHGIVVQLAQSDFSEGDEGWEGDPAPADLPAPTPNRPALLERIVHLVADLPAALELFAALLGGDAVASGRDELGEWTELHWRGPGRLRLVRPDLPDARAWLGERSGRLHHLRFALDDPTAVPDAARAGEGLWVVPPEANLGVRLHLVAG